MTVLFGDALRALAHDIGAELGMAVSETSTSLVSTAHPGQRRLPDSQTALGHRLGAFERTATEAHQVCSQMFTERP